jgi:chorismate dehydratase
VRISIVSFLNSFPYVVALERLAITQPVQLFKDTPARCAQRLLNDEADIGLLPVAVIPQLKEHYLVSDFCIGAVREVRSVMIFSEVPIQQVKQIVLDPQSRTSALLAQIMAHSYWKITPVFVTGNGLSEPNLSGPTAELIIGDKALMLQGKFPYQYDLATAWNDFTGLPFVFACWVSNKPVDSAFLKQFNTALHQGVSNRAALAMLCQVPGLSEAIKADYLNRIIRYHLDDDMKKGMNRFLTMIQQMCLLV